MHLIDGNFTENITQDYIGSIDQDYTQNIGGNRENTIACNFSEFVGANATYKIVDDESKSIGGNKDCTVSKDCANIYTGKYTITVGNLYKLQANKDILATSKFGNIELLTQGEFEITETPTGPVTAKGYSNLGKCGNIKLTSTFGNIRN